MKPPYFSLANILLLEEVIFSFTHRNLDQKEVSDIIGLFLYLVNKTYTLLTGGLRI